MQPQVFVSCHSSLLSECQKDPACDRILYAAVSGPAANAGAYLILSNWTVNTSTWSGLMDAFPRQP